MTTPSGNDESGWVLERGDSNKSKPLYWNGTRDGTQMIAWTHDDKCAIRFAREIDASVVAINLMGVGDTYIRTRVCEHLWIAP